jgi:RES domain-containing protein
MLYTAGSESLATLEVLALFDDEKAPADQCVVVLELPDAQIHTLHPLPTDLNLTPAGLASKYAGTEFLKAAKHLVLKVPSVIIKSEFNYLVNPLHPAMKKVKVAKVYDKVWDERIIGRER